MTLYQCGDCGYRLLPEQETVLESRFIAFRLVSNGNVLPPGYMMPVRVCKDRYACYRRERDCVRSGAMTTLEWLEELAQKRYSVQETWDQ